MIEIKDVGRAIAPPFGTYQKGLRLMRKPYIAAGISFGAAVGILVGSYIGSPVSGIGLGIAVGVIGAWLYDFLKQ